MDNGEMWYNFDWGRNVKGAADLPSWARLRMNYALQLLEKGGYRPEAECLLRDEVTTFAEMLGVDVREVEVQDLPEGAFAAEPGGKLTMAASVLSLAPWERFVVIMEALKVSLGRTAHCAVLEGQNSENLR
jgi:hypothetical protein